MPSKPVDWDASARLIRLWESLPLSLRVAIQMVVVTSLTYLPLMLLDMPINEIVKHLSGALF
jgi:hypothetical protein